MDRFASQTDSEQNGEYDASIRQEYEALTREMERLKQRQSLLELENTKYREELKENAERQLRNVTDGELPEPSTRDFIQNIQHQLQKALEEKEHSTHMWQLAQRQIEQLEEETQRRSVHPQLQMMERQAHKIKEQYLRTTEELTTELRSAQVARDRLVEQLTERGNLLQRLQLELQESQGQLSRTMEERASDEEEREQMRKKVTQLHSRVKDLEAGLNEAENVKLTLKSEVKSLSAQLGDLQKKCVNYEQNEFDSTAKVKVYARAVEEAALERDQAVQREHQRQEEIDRLQKAVADIMGEAAAKARQEVDTVKKQCNDTLLKYTEDIHNLEMEISEKQNQFDRLMREKRMVENELDKYRKEENKQVQKETTALEDLMRRACTAERARDDALMKVDGLTNRIKRLETSLKQEKKEQESEVARLRELNVRLSADLDESQKDRIRLQELVAEQKNSLAAALREKELAQRSTAKLKSEMEHEMVQRKKEFDVRLEAVEESHQRSQATARQMLAAQQRAALKSREENDSLVHKYETRVQEVTGELSQQRKRNSELARQVHEMQAKVAEAEKMVGEYTRHIQKLEERLQLAEDRARMTHALALHHSAGSSSNGTRTTRNIVEERRQMQRELERNIKEAKNLINLSMTENSAA